MQVVDYTQVSTLCVSQLIRCMSGFKSYHDVSFPFLSHSTVLEMILQLHKCKQASPQLM